MSTKEKYFDPPTEYESDCESEESVFANNVHTEHQLNNSKVYSASPPGFVAFVRNDVSVGGRQWRRGGPLGDPPPNNKVPVKTRPCVKCGRSTSVWYAGERFLCDEWYADEPEQLEEHNRLCKECAFNKARCSSCPVHPGGHYKDDGKEISPEEVWRAGE